MRQRKLLELPNNLAHARAVGRFRTFFSLWDAWEVRKRPSESVEGIIADCRQIFSAGGDFTDADRAQWDSRLVRLVETIVIRFNRLIATGAVDSILPRLTALPVLYTPHAGTGAMRWVGARELFNSKRVASEALIEHLGDNSNVGRTSQWGELAEDAVRVAQLAALELRETGKQQFRRDASAYYVRDERWNGARKGQKVARTTFYFSTDGWVLAWPAWVDRCANLPERVSDDPALYRAALVAIIDDFFAQPRNPFAASILHGYLIQNDWSYAVKEARKAILKAAL